MIPFGARPPATAYLILWLEPPLGVGSPVVDAGIYTEACPTPVGGRCPALLAEDRSPAYPDAFLALVRRLESDRALRPLLDAPTLGRQRTIAPAPVAVPRTLRERPPFGR